MSAQKGKDLLLKLDDGTGNFVTVAGLRTRRLAHRGRGLISMVNPHRGEIVAEFDGRPHTLCLTLGALAELESKFDVSGLVELASRFENGRLSARDLIAVIACGLRGAGAAY